MHCASEYDKRYGETPLNENKAMIHNETQCADVFSIVIFPTHFHVEVGYKLRKNRVQRLTKCCLYVSKEFDITIDMLRQWEILVYQGKHDYYFTRFREGSKKVYASLMQMMGLNPGFKRWKDYFSYHDGSDRSDEPPPLEWEYDRGYRGTGNVPCRLGYMLQQMFQRVSPIFFAERVTTWLLIANRYGISKDIKHLVVKYLK